MLRFKKKKSEKTNMVSQKHSLTLETSAIYNIYSSIVSDIMQAATKGMPYIPLTEWLQRFDATPFIDIRTDEHMQLVERLKADLLMLSNLLRYSVKDSNGFYIRQ